MQAINAVSSTRSLASLQAANQYEGSNLHDPVDIVVDPYSYDERREYVNSKA